MGNNNQSQQTRQGLPNPLLNLQYDIPMIQFHYRNCYIHQNNPPVSVYANYYENYPSSFLPFSLDNNASSITHTSYDSSRLIQIDIEDTNNQIEFLNSVNPTGGRAGRVKKSSTTCKLKKKIIYKLMTTKKYKIRVGKQQPEECCICLEEFNAKSMMGILSCGHQFHKKCIGSWFQKDGVCPLCRLKIL